jgi:hypothetical protein
MAVTYTSTLQPEFHRENLTFTDSFGHVSKLIIYANNFTNRTQLIQSRLQIAQANEAAMVALIAACNPSSPPQ